VAQLGARLDGIEEVVGSNPIGSTNFVFLFNYLPQSLRGNKSRAVGLQPHQLTLNGEW
jgi:hypothetical protein